VAFYSVPHALFQDISKFVNKLLRCNNRHYPGITDNIELWQRDMEQLLVDFDVIVSGNNIKRIAFCEGMDTKQMVRMVWMKWISCNP